MRVSLRIILSLIAGVTLVTFLFARSGARAEERTLRSDLQRRSNVLAESLADVIGPLGGESCQALLQQRRIQQIVERFGNRERLAGVLVYDAKGRLLAITLKLAQQFAKHPILGNEAVRHDRE